MTHLCSVRVSSCTLIHYISPTSIFVLFSPLSMFLNSLILSFCYYFLRFVSYFSPRYTSYTLVLPLQPRAFPMLFYYVSIHHYIYPSFVRVLCVSKYILLPEYTLNVPLLAYINSLIMYRLWPTLFYFPIISQLFVTTTFLSILEYLY